MAFVLGTKSLTVADQAVASLGNVVLTVIVARTVSPHAFGEYALLLAGYQLALAATQAIVGEPLLVTLRRKAGPTTDGMVGAALGVALILGVLLLAVAEIAGLVFGLGPALVCLGLLLPGLLVQDALRYVAFVRAQPGYALLSDTCWVVLQFATTAVMLQAGVREVWLLILAWGAPASLSAILIVVLTKARPAPLSGREWIRATRHLSGRFVLESATSTGAYQLVIVIASATAGIVVAGQLRLVQALFGPLHVIVTGVRSATLPEVAERLRQGTPCRSVVARTSVLLGAAATTWTAVLLLLPDAVGSAAFGPAWSGLGVVILLSGLQKFAESIGTGPYLLHRARQLASWTLRVRLVSAALMAAAAVVMAARWGAAGASAAILLGSAYAVSCWWLRYAAEIRAGRSSEIHRKGGRHRRPSGRPALGIAGGYAGGGADLRSGVRGH